MAKKKQLSYLIVPALLYASSSQESFGAYLFPTDGMGEIIVADRAVASTEGSQQPTLLYLVAHCTHTHSHSL